MGSTGRVSIAIHREKRAMIVDFQHHFTPRELVKDDVSGGKLILKYDKWGAPSYTNHELLFDLDAHIKMMDRAGIDVAMLSCAAGMCGDLEPSKFINDKAKQAERDYPGRFIGTAHADPLGGKDAFRELARCKHELGFPGIVIQSEVHGLHLDSPELNPFWEECQKLGLFVFVHPALALMNGQFFDTDDLARSVGREFSLVVATIKLINGGVLDRFPGLKVQMAHLSGGVASVLGRIRSYQDKNFWGTAGNPKHGRLPEKDFDHYINQRLVFDTAGFCGAISSVKSSLVELPVGRIVFGSDYPQEIRDPEAVRAFVAAIRKLGRDGSAILEGNVGHLLPEPARAA
jgi:aminocarboxymuconate-semialdehyde decarboxylase